MHYFWKIRWIFPIKPLFFSLLIFQSRLRVLFSSLSLLEGRASLVYWCVVMAALFLVTGAHGVAVCCNMLQYVILCGAVLLWIIMLVLATLVLVKGVCVCVCVCVRVCCVLYRAAVCCNVLHCVAVCICGCPCLCVSVVVWGCGRVCVCHDVFTLWYVTCSLFQLQLQCFAVCCSVPSQHDTKHASF